MRLSLIYVKETFARLRAMPMRSIARQPRNARRFQKEHLAPLAARQGRMPSLLSSSRNQEQPPGFTNLVLPSCRHPVRSYPGQHARHAGGRGLRACRRPGPRPGDGGQYRHRSQPGRRLLGAAVRSSDAGFCVEWRADRTLWCRAHQPARPGELWAGASFRQWRDAARRRVGGAARRRGLWPEHPVEQPGSHTGHASTPTCAHVLAKAKWRAAWRDARRFHVTPDRCPSRLEDGARRRLRPRHYDRTGRGTPAPAPRHRRATVAFFATRLGLRVDAIRT